MKPGVNSEGAVLLLGGRSEIGLKVAERLAPGRTVILAARRSDDLQAESAHVKAAGAKAVHSVEFDADEVAAHPELLTKVFEDFGPIAVTVVAFGILGDQSRAEQDPTHAIAIVHTDYVAQISVLTTLANLHRAQAAGDLVVFSSVAGIRVRRANYVYGSAKAGLDGFANGLSDALHKTGVHLLLVRSGFVIGRMTKGMAPAPLSSTPDQVADAVVKALHRRKTHVWVPFALRPAYFVARLVPQRLWRKLPR